MKKSTLSLFALSLCLNSIDAKRSTLFVTTMPKSGTHLLQKIIYSLTGELAEWPKEATTMQQHECDVICTLKKRYYFAHAPCIGNNLEIAKKNNLNVILLLRDPRDVLVSYAYWVKKDPDHLLFADRETLYPYWNEIPSWSIETMISHFITHYPCKGPLVKNFATIAEFYSLYLDWDQYPNLHITTFEKLIGPQGGGDTVTQENEILAIASFLQIPTNKDDIKEICSSLFGGTSTFREGKIGSWKKELTEEHKQALKKLPGFNELLIKLNYEKDNNW